MRWKEEWRSEVLFLLFCIELPIAKLQFYEWRWWLITLTVVFFGIYCRQEGRKQVLEPVQKILARNAVGEK